MLLLKIFNENFKEVCFHCFFQVINSSNIAKFLMKQFSLKKEKSFDLERF